MIKTNPGGRMLISYRRQRADEIALLEQALHDRGIPTWLDTADLPFGHTPTEIDQALADPDTAGAILFLTPEVADSAYVMDIEIPGAFGRAKESPFILVPVAAGGLDYASAATMLRGRTGPHDLSHWNVVHIESPPMTATAARGVAIRTLRQRISHFAMSDGMLSIAVSTRTPLAFEPDRIGLRIDHRRFFDGRVVRPGSPEVLKEALDDIRDAMAANAPSLRAQFEGQVTIGFAMALGRAFSATSGMTASWLQRRAGTADEIWILANRPNGISTEVEVVRGDPGSQQIAFVVSVADNAEPAFERAQPRHGPFGANVFVRARALSPLSPDTANNIAFDAVSALRQARELLGGCTSVHFFGAVPVGLAFMIGQLLNTFNVVSTYEFEPSGYVSSGLF